MSNNLDQEDDMLDEYDFSKGFVANMRANSRMSADWCLLIQTSRRSFLTLKR